ncbi:carbonyl reductase [NADPH] 3 isoform X2 [Ochotona princeps]|uniref:carbonyl reductase [NADPH] 3 isoform X2 n=1 Tax=Ochotona princeps TaxID=9978 RepID=UPI002714EDFA|nr:carbonyl reductase [NADPH] 3 isoform X2 [Ochotona princeps]
MSSCSRVALVTGANKGVGFAIARDLCRRFSGDVVLTARDEARGRAAVQQLQAEGLSPRFHKLDITDLQSIRTLRDFLRREYGGLNVLVNNAGIAFESDDPTPFDIQAELTMKTNFFATRSVCTELLPIMKPHGRVVNISSLQGSKALEDCSEDLREKFRCETLSEGDLVDLMKKFVEDTRNESNQEGDLPSTDSFRKSPPQLELSQTKVRNQELELSLPHGWLGHRCCLSRHMSRSRAVWTQT